MNNSKPDGFHFLLEFFGCDLAQINSMEFWRTELHASITGTTMESLHDFFFQFEPQGITGYLLLSSSHISIHTWPENGYVVCDVFTCSTEVETEQAVQYLKDHITHERVEVKKIQRGFKVSRKGGVMQDIAQCTLDRHCMTLPVYSTGEMMPLDVIQTIVEIETALQKIQIVDTVDYGKCLIINGILHSAEKDHYLYDRELIKHLRSSDQDILILGGGDGYVARRVISENPDSQITVDVVDVDVEVVKACERYLGQDVFTSDKVKIHIGDALQFLKMTQKKYDGVIFDMTKEPIGRTQEIQFVQFYKDLCALAFERTKDHAWIAVQAGTTSVADKYMNTSMILTSILHDAQWQDVDRSDVMIPSHGESYAFLFAKKNERMVDKIEEIRTITQPIYATGKDMTITVTEKLAEIQSEFQKIAFVDTKKFGRCLIIDGVVQTSTSDHEIYDAQMLAKMRETDNDILILGGGDGYVAQMAVAQNDHVHVEIADLDVMVVEGCKKYLDQKIFDDERVQLHIGDALAYMRESGKTYDGIVCDLTDMPIGSTKELESYKEFFADVIECAAQCMNDGAWMSIQAGASDVSDQYINSVEVITAMLQERFTEVERTDVLIPSFGEKCAFLFCRKHG